MGQLPGAELRYCFDACGEDWPLPTGPVPVPHPRAWSPDAPELHHVTVTMLSTPLDHEKHLRRRFGPPGHLFFHLMTVVGAVFQPLNAQERGRVGPDRGAFRSAAACG